MTISRHHLGRNAVRDEHIPSSEIPYTDLKTNTIQLVIPFTVLWDEKSVAADAVGIRNVPGTYFIIPTNMLKHLKSASVAVGYVWAATADGTIQLYDITADVVRGESTAKTGGESSAWEIFGAAGLVEGNHHRLRVNITTAGAAGETVTLSKAHLLLTLGVS